MSYFNIIQIILYSSRFLMDFSVVKKFDNLLSAAKRKRERKGVV